jgi:hypothetical protein
VPKSFRKRFFDLPETPILINRRDVLVAEMALEGSIRNRPEDQAEIIEIEREVLARMRHATWPGAFPPADEKAKEVQAARELAKAIEPVVSQKLTVTYTYDPDGFDPEPFVRVPLNDWDALVAAHKQLMSHTQEEGDQ